MDGEEHMILSSLYPKGRAPTGPLALLQRSQVKVMVARTSGELMSNNTTVNSTLYLAGRFNPKVLVDCLQNIGFSSMQL